MSKTVNFTATGTATISGGGNRLVAVGIAVGVPAVLVLGWVFAHAFLLVGITVAIVVAGAGLYLLAVWYHEGRGVIIAAGFAELHERRRAQLPPQPPVQQLTAGVQLVLSGPEAVELARKLIEAQRPAIPARIHSSPGQAGDAITEGK